MTDLLKRFVRKRVVRILSLGDILGNKAKAYFVLNSQRDRLVTADNTHWMVLHSLDISVVPYLRIQLHTLRL